MNRKDVIKYCLELPDVYEDYPFQDDSVTIKNDNIKVTKKGNIKITNIGYFFDG